MINFKITSKKINLSNKKERIEYSGKLQEFEKQFTYLLGGERFYIQHGVGGDYFSFFEKLGRPNVMVLEDNGRVIGVCCAVLREINQQKYWYLCDFKIKKECRGRKLYRQLMWKYFLPCYIKSKNAFAINMGSSDNNRLFSHVKRIFKVFNIGIESNYLYSFSGKNIAELPFNFFNKNIIVSNNGDKDIVVGGVVKKLFHIVDLERFNKSLGEFSELHPGCIANNDLVMFLSCERMNFSFAEESVISLFNKGKDFLRISSAEI